MQQSRKVKRKIEKMGKNLRIFLGDICYPKSEVLVIPSNSVGIMNRGILHQIAKVGGILLINDSKKQAKEKKVEVGDYFCTIPARFKKRGVKKIYHCVIKRLPSDYTSINSIGMTLRKIMFNIIAEGFTTMTICGMGIDTGDLDPISVARIIYSICKSFTDKIQIRIIDRNVEFIEEVSKLAGIKYE